ncbi:MAG: hypothetical protein ACLFRG_21565 [Desulfococcaceae bacterium]
MILNWDYGDFWDGLDFFAFRIWMIKMKSRIDRMARNDPENPAIILKILIQTFPNWDLGD